jgi:protein SCO1
MSETMRICWENSPVRTAVAGVALALALVLSPLATQAQFTDPLQNIGVHPELLKDVRFDQELDHKIPLDLIFRDEDGRTVELGQYFGQKPVILTLVYYTCPLLCTEVLNGLERSLKNIPPSIGKDFNVVTVSIDPSDTAAVAGAKQEMYTGLYGRAGAAQGWHFLTGAEPEIKQLADAVGFHYAYDSDSKQFAHPAGIMILTPDGRLSRYFYGVEYSERDLRLGLLAASQGKIGSPIDKALAYCYHYDPHTGKYGLLIARVMQIAGGLTVLVGGILLFLLFRGEHYELSPGRRV